MQKKFEIKIEYMELRNKKNLFLSKKNKDSKLFVAYYLKNVRLIDNFQSYKKYAPTPKNETKPITSVIVVTNTPEAIAGSIFIFFKVTGTKIPKRPAIIIVKIIEMEIIIERVLS